MPGFILINKKLKNNFKNISNKNLIIEKIESSDIEIQRKTINKFLKDKVFFNDLIYTIVIEGVIFNKLELIEKYNKKTFKDTIVEMYKKEGESFFSKFRGSFSGVFIDKEKNIKLIFTDHIGDKQIFYNTDFNNIIISTNLNDIIEIFNLNKIEYSLNKEGVYCILNHGYMLDKLTYLNEVKKLIAGTYLKITEEKQIVKEYHRFDNTPILNRTDNELIENIDKLFLNALKKQLNKNKEYGYENFSPLSAGLDSRMVNFGLDKLETNNIYNFTYSQTNYYDEVIPKKIANDLKRHWIFKSLDNGLSIKDNIDLMIDINCGQVLYYGPGQVYDILNTLNHKKLGIIHTGMLGDVVVGTFFQEKNQNQKYRIEDGCYSKKLIKKLKKIINTNDMRKYQNQEIYNFYNRGFNGANLGSPLVFQEETESFSPFYDVELLEYCLTIPVEKRWNNNLYDKWILKKYPEAAKYLHNGVRKIGGFDKKIKLLKKEIGIKEFIPKGTKYILRKIGFLKKSLNTKHHMNPLDYWYNTNLELKMYLDSYFEDNLKKIKESEIKKDCIDLYVYGNTIEKTQVLTFLGFLKKYF